MGVGEAAELRHQLVSNTKTFHVCISRNMGAAHTTCRERPSHRRSPLPTPQSPLPMAISQRLMMFFPCVFNYFAYENLIKMKPLLEGGGLSVYTLHFREDCDG